MTDKPLYEGRNNARNISSYCIVYPETKVREAVKKLKQRFFDVKEHDSNEEVVVYFDDIDDVINEVFGKELTE